jgi:succinate dehydrogenase / fumarate reductase cytochrome b subunit
VIRELVRQNYFFLRRLHSLSGIVPFGGFLLMHMFLNSRAAQGRAEYQWVPDTLDQIPFLWAIEIFGLLLPMLFHAGLGVVIAVNADYGGPAKMRSNAEHWGFIFQRVSGVLLLGLLVTHLFQTWGPHMALKLPAMLKPGTPLEHFDIYGHMNKLLGTGPWLLVYGLFVLLAAFHFGNGIFNFAFKWGLATSKASQRGALALGMGVALLCVVLGFSSIWGLMFSPWADDSAAASYSPPRDHGTSSAQAR